VIVKEFIHVRYSASLVPSPRALRNWPSLPDRSHFQIGRRSLELISTTLSSSEIFYQVTAINEFGQVTQYQTQNGQVSNDQQFYPNSKRLKTLSATGPPEGTFLSKTYKLDKVSNVKSITDNVSSHSWSRSGTLTGLVYDDLHASPASPMLTRHTPINTTESAILWLTATSAPALTPTTPPIPMRSPPPNGKTYGYDANGNMTSRNGQTLRYDEENRLAQLTGTGYNIHFGYAYDGARL
jgi:hypothetical protein